MSGKSTKMTLKTKLLIFEYKEKFPQLSPECVSDILNIHLRLVEKLFNEGTIEVPSKMNVPWTKKKGNSQKVEITT